MGVMETTKILSNALLKLKDPELMAEYVKLQQAVMELFDENARLKEEIVALKKGVDIQEGLLFERGVYFTNHTGKKDGPYCQRCWDKDKTLIRLKVYSEGRAYCLECKNGYPYLDQ